MTDIFLSYSSRDRERVRPIRDALAALRYNVFWDVERPAGVNGDQWIRGHIAKAKVVIVFWTRNSAASVNVQHECAMAREDSKLAPVLLEAMKAVDFPMGFYTTQAAALHDWDGRAAHPGSGSWRRRRAMRSHTTISPSCMAKGAEDWRKAKRRLSNISGRRRG
jgi:hypothetical protein